MRFVRTFSLAVLVLVGAAASAGAQDFPPITETERAFTSFPGEPNAPAVVLFRKAEFLMWGADLKIRFSSRLIVRERRKILTEQGRDLAEIAVEHSHDVRLVTFRGRTVLPDGRVLPLKDDSRFERKSSKRNRSKVTAVTFPGVEVGAILDYEYELRFQSIYLLEPWYFSAELPVVRSEMLYRIPPEIRVNGWDRDPFRVGLQRETKKTIRGAEVRVWAENLPSVPDEPYGLPFADLATQMMMVPTAFQSGSAAYQPLMESWPAICKLYEEDYARARARDAGVADKARQIAAKAGPSPRAKAEALYRFVRDEIETLDAPGVSLDEGSTVEKTLSQRSGDYAEKALLLQSMLGAAGLEARLVWAADRWNGEIDPQIANPWWFDTVLVSLELDGQRVYLDPSDRALAFGRLEYGYEGTPVLIHDAKKPEGIVLPATPFDQNARRAAIDLDLDAEGRLAGKGEVTFTGHHAWRKTDWQKDEAATLEAWKKWLGEEYPGFQVEDVRFEEKPDEGTVRLTWAMKQREEEVLGDETSLFPSHPLGPVRQPFVQDASLRRSPLLFSFPSRDEVEVRVRWPEGWDLESQPKLASTKNRVGALSVEVNVDDAGRSVVYRRRMDVNQRQFGIQEHYREARALFGAAEKSDAEALVLARR